MEHRECEIRILNGTSCTFYRYMHLVKHGIWSINPPEYLNSKNEEKCMAKFTKTMGNFYGILQYCVVINGEEYILNARFDIPFLGDNIASAVLGLSIKNDKKQVLSKQNYFIIKHTFDNTYNGKFFINIVETEEGRKFIEYHKRKLKKGLLRILNVRTLEEKMKKENLAESSKKNGSNEDMLQNNINYHSYKYQDMLDVLPLSFIINVKNYDWKKRLRKSHKSLYILIINFTKQTLNLADQKGMKSLMLTEGNWIEFPNEKIPSLRSSEFGCNNDGIFSGISGFCKYNFMNEFCELHIQWEINNVNSKIKCNIKNSTKYTVIKHVEIFNECTAIFHILESYYYPPVKLLECRALTNQIINTYGIEKDNIDKHMGVIYQCSINVIRQFCQYLQNNDIYKNNSNENFINPIYFKTLMDKEQEDDFSSKQGFSSFSRMNYHLASYAQTIEDRYLYNCNLEKKTINDINILKNHKNYYDSSSNFSEVKNMNERHLNLLKKRPPSSHNMYIKKNNVFSSINITSARDFFCYIHGNSYSNNIPINSHLYISWNIGNIIYRNLYNSSEHIIINAHSLLSSQNINEDVILKLKIDENNKKIYPSNLIQNLLMNTQSNIYIHNEYVILDIILNIFHILSSTLSPIIEKILETEYGPQWIKDSKIPKSNMWEKSKGKTELDIEGIIHLITTFWIDIFEKKIKNLEVIDNLQKASIFWTNQEIDQFDQEFVKKVIESSSLLLKIFGDYNTAKSIENLYYNKYSIFNDICVD